MRKLVLAALALALALALAAPAGAADRVANFTFGYDVDSTTMTYCVLKGQRNDPYDTTGIKRTVADYDITLSAGTLADGGTSGAFAPVDVGDMVILRAGDEQTPSTATDIFTWITAKASDNSVTVYDASSSGTWRAYFYKKLSCGINETDGWIPVSELESLQMSVNYAAGDLGGLDVVWECKGSAPGSPRVQVYPGPSSDCGFGTLNTNVCTFATVGDALTRQITGAQFGYCRMGLAYRTSDGGTADAIHATIEGTTRQK